MLNNNIIPDTKKASDFAADTGKNSKNTPEKDTRLESALAYARRGWPVFPVGDNKRPAIKNWERTATTDENQIRSWYENISMNGCNFGFCPGRAGIAVIDLDMNKKDKDGNAVHGNDSLAAFCGDHGKTLPETYTVRTPSGGLHQYYKVPHEIRSKNSFLPAVDVKTSGGYVVIPGSINANGGKYEVTCGIAVADMPQWFLDLYGRQANAEVAKEKDTQPPADITADAPDKIKRAAEIISGWEPCDEGVRNDQLYQMMRELLKAGISKKKAAELYEDYGVDKIGLAPNAAEVQKTIDSAYKDMSDFGSESEEHGKNAINLFDDLPAGESSGEAAGITTGAAGNGKPWLKFHPMSYYRANFPDEGIEYYVEGIIPDRPALSILYADAGAGKTTIACMLMECITAGLDFMGLRTRRETKRGVFRPAILNFEEDDGTVSFRSRKQAEALELNKYGDRVEPQSTNLFGRNVQLFKKGAGGLMDYGCDFPEIKRQVVDQGINFLIIDTLSRVFVGDENDRETVARFGSLMDRFIRETSCAVLLIGHNNKGHNYSGSSAWEGIVRQRYSLKKVGQMVTLTVEKTNWMPAGSAVSGVFQNWIYRPVSADEAAGMREAAEGQEKTEAHFVEKMVLFLREHFSGQGSILRPDLLNFDNGGEKAGKARAAKEAAVESLIKNRVITEAGTGRAASGKLYPKYTQGPNIHDAEEEEETAI